MIEPFECDVCNSDLDPDGTCPMCIAQSKIDNVIIQYDIGILHWRSSKEPSPIDFFEFNGSKECACAICRGNPSDDAGYIYLFGGKVIQDTEYQDEYFSGNDQTRSQEEDYTEDDELTDMFFSGFFDQ